MKTSFFSILAIVLQTGIAVSGDLSDGKAISHDTLETPSKVAFFSLNSEYSHEILNWQENVTEKPFQILEYSRDGVLSPNAIVLSGAFWGTFMHEESNTPGKFPILSRFPNQHGATDTKADRWVFNNAALTLTARAGEWVTLFAQGEGSDIEFLGQNQYQMRKAWVMVGNLER